MKIKTKMGANDATDKGLVSKIYQQTHAIFYIKKNPTQSKSGES